VTRCWRPLIYVVLISTVAFTYLGASPRQSERPPQPFFQDFFSGIVTHQGAPPPMGTLLVACIDDCLDGFESEPSVLKPDGTFDQLEVNPGRQDLVGHTITFYLLNSFGRIKAAEERPYIGVFDFYVQNLTFDEPLPAPPATKTPMPTIWPTPTASLPIAGDPAVNKVPRIAVTVGLIGVILGSLLLFVARRKVT